MVETDKKMSGIQHGERELEEKDELTFIRKRNRSVQVFDEWKRKNEEECEKLAQQLLNKESREHDKQCAIQQEDFRDGRSLYRQWSKNCNR